MRRFLILASALFVALVSQGALVGVIINIKWETWGSYAYEPSTGVYSYKTLDRYYEPVFVPYSGSGPAPTLSTLGLSPGKCMDGSTRPNPPMYSAGVYIVCAGSKDIPVYNSSDFPTDQGTLYLGPIYNQSSGLPFSMDSYGYYSGANPNFDISSITPLQGNVGSSDSGPWVTYSSSGAPRQSGSAPSDGDYEWTYNNENGWMLAPVGGSSGGDSGSSVDLSPVVDAINNQGQLSRDQLVQLLGSAGNSWVYDCKLSLSQLYALASSQGLITRPQVDFSGVYSRLDSLVSKPNVDVSSLAKDSTVASVASGVSSVNANITSLRNDVSALAKESTLQSAVSSLSSIDGKFSTIGLDIASMKNILQDWDNTIPPVFDTSPDFGYSTPDDELPFDVSGFNASVTQSLGTLVSWGDSGVPKVFDFDIVSHLLSDMIGTIPSVGSDPVMFSIDFDLPYIGHINKTFSFADYPFVGEFRSFLLWVIYVFFALACFKLLHATII